MKNIKNSCLFTFVVMFFVGNVIAMRMTPQQMERGKVATRQVITQMEERKTQYFIHEQDNRLNGIWVDKQLAKNNSQSIKNMVEDFGEELIDIPLPCSLDTIKLGFDLLQDKKDVKDLSFDQLVDIANFFNFLDVPADKMQAVLVRIKDIIDSNPNNIAANETLKKLNPDLQKSIMTKQNIINCLKDCIAQKYTKDRGKPLVGHPAKVKAIAFSSDGTKMVSGCDENEHVFMKNNVILWDISNLNNITSHTIFGGWNILSASFSPDNKYVVSNSDIFDAIVLWNISDLNQVAQQNTTARKIIGQGQDRFKSVAFSPDGKNVFSCGRHFIVWDVSDPANITHRQLLTGVREGSVFSPDGTLVASVSDRDDMGKYNSFTIFDVSGSIVHTYKKNEEQLGGITCLAFSPDGKTVISYGDKLVLWDVSDLNNIKSHVLFSNLITTEEEAMNKLNVTTYLGRSLILSYDGKKIALGFNNRFILLDIHNPNNQIEIGKIGMSVDVMAFSPDGKQMITGGKSLGMFGKNLILWTLLTDQEEVLLNQIKNYNADQVRLIYQLCLQSSKKQAIALKKGSEEEQIFKTLPEDMQKLLSDLFLPKSWISGWW
jgi:WD40 repeat protein